MNSKGQAGPLAFSVCAPTGRSELKGNDPSQTFRCRRRGRPPYWTPSTCAATSLPSSGASSARPVAPSPPANPAEPSAGAWGDADCDVTTSPANVTSTVDRAESAGPPGAGEKRFGYASLIGPSNSGKSTLLNRLVGTKVAIVTPKVQTTRCRIAGIVMYGCAQVAYLDTPGIFTARGRLDRAMVKSAWGSGNAGDTVSVVLDVAEMFFVARKRAQPSLFVSEAASMVLDGVAKKRARGRIPQLCVLANKIDTIPPADRDAVLQKVHDVLARFGISEDAVVFPISALHGDGLPVFTEWVVARTPPGPWLYPDDDLTDMNARLIAAEVTREKLFLCLRNELPYEIAVETTSYKESEKDGSIRITQDIYVRRESQLKIVTGLKAAMVKKIGMQSRAELKEILGEEVHLMLKVKVRQKWKDDARQYEQWGLDYRA